MKMKNVFFVVFLVLVSVFINSCQKEPEIVPPGQGSAIEYRELTDSEKLLKNQLAEAAKIIAEIGDDPAVLSDIVETIKKQPREMEDKVKFAHLMKRSSQLKSLDILQGSGVFAKAFSDQLQSDPNLKSSSTLVDDLISKGIEIYIPYPIEDYPIGTNIVITSNPIDNSYENIGYFLGRPDETLLANEELTEVYPVIIVNLGQSTDEQIEKSLNMNELDQQEKSATSYIDPLSVWEDDSNYRFQVYIGEVYIKNDGVEGLFTDPGRLFFTTAGVTFNSLNSHVTLPAEGITEEAFGEYFPRKYERYAKDGYGKGWFYVHTVLMEDWHPGISEKPFVTFMDHPTKEVTKVSTVVAKIIAEMSSELLGIPGLVLKPEGSITESVSSKITYSDLLYRIKTYYRSTYKYDYNRTGDYWSDIYENHFRYYAEYPELGNRPALKLTNEFFYTTYVRVIPK